ncbi:MAG: 7,8-didemethyl-8-hydroxy-5-deazariboflavin synthase subunit CofG [Candidatus Hermodarchaeota archaeon]
MDVLSSSNLMSSSKLSVKKALNFLHTENSDEILTWKKSCLSISINEYNRHVTFTTNVFIPITYLCRNECSYCGYRRSKVEKGKEYTDPNEIERILLKAKRKKVSEVLLTLGEKPESKYSAAQKWLSKNGYGSTIDYIYFIAQKALDFGLLTHINAGSINYDELKILKEVSASMGVMLEILGTRLTLNGMPHAKSPDKHPKKRLTTIKNAGKLKIPFTSGLLVGIGETPKEIVSSLYALRNIHKKYRHLQEVIIQNFHPHIGRKMIHFPAISIEYLEKVVILARHILPSEISIQVPPNLIKGNEPRFLEAGVSDWGGISSITHDYINPDHSWPKISHLQNKTTQAGFILKERLPVYPRYIRLPWLSKEVYSLITSKDFQTKDGSRKRYT